MGQQLSLFLTLYSFYSLHTIQNGLVGNWSSVCLTSMFVCFFILSIFYCPKKQDQVQVLSFYSINRLPVGEVNDISSTKHLTLFHILV